jgi:hypothetical protein
MKKEKKGFFFDKNGDGYTIINQDVKSRIVWFVVFSLYSALAFFTGWIEDGTYVFAITMLVLLSVDLWFDKYLFYLLNKK